MNRHRHGTVILLRPSQKLNLDRHVDVIFLLIYKGDVQTVHNPHRSRTVVEIDSRQILEQSRIPLLASYAEEKSGNRYYNLSQFHISFLFHCPEAERRISFRPAVGS